MKLFRAFPEQLHLLVIGHRQSYLIDNYGERIKVKSFMVEHTNSMPRYDNDSFKVDHGLFSVRMEFYDGYVYVGWHRISISVEMPAYAFSKALRELMDMVYSQSGLKRLGYVMLDGLTAFLRRWK